MFRSPSRTNNKEVKSPYQTGDHFRKNARGGRDPSPRALNEEKESVYKGWKTEGREAASFASTVEELVMEINKISDAILPNTRMEIRNSASNAKLIMLKLGEEIEKVAIINRPRLESLMVKSRKEEQDSSPLEVLPDLTIDTSINIEEVEKILNKKWSEPIYKKVKMMKGSPGVDGDGCNTAFILGSDPGKNAPLIEIARRKHSDIDEIIQENQVKDSYQVIETTKKIKGKESKTSLCFVTEVVDTKDMVAALVLMKEELARHNVQSKKLNIATSMVGDVNKLRKVAELVFTGSDLDITILLPPRARINEPGNGAGENSSSSGERASTGLVKINSSMSYADMTKIVKEFVKPDEIGVEVQKLRKGKSESLVIVTKQKEDAKTLKEEIIRKAGAQIADFQVEEGGRKEYVMIHDIDSLTTKDEVEKSILEIIGADQKEEMQIDIKENRRGNLIGVVTMNKDKAKILLDQEKIKIGWINCRVQRKAKVTRCYKCLRLGHSFFQCRDKATPGKKCFKCTELGHEAQNCKNRPKCNSCRKEGHRADSVDCPHFRRILAKVSNSK